MWLRLAGLARWGIVLAWVAFWVLVALQWWPTRVRLGWGASWYWALLASIALIAALQVWRRAHRERMVREAPLPKFLHRKLRERWPHLTAKDCELVERGLRQFFWACLRSDKAFVAMPSQAVDAMWHEFILHTRGYQQWCQAALGRFLHHTPAEALGGDPRRNDGLRRAWFWACRDEAIDPRHPTRLPLLFALDAKLAIEGGFRYLPDCSDINRKSDAGGDGGQTYCATGFSDGSHGGDGDSFGGADDSGGGDGGGDGGGCGGD